MHKVKPLLLLMVIGLLAAACKTPGDGGTTPEPPEETASATVEPTAEPEDTGADEAETSGAPSNATSLRFPLVQIAEGSTVTLSPYDVSFYSSGETVDLQSAFAAAVAPQGCVVATDIGGDGSIGDGYICKAAEGENATHFAALFSYEPEGFREVNVRFGSPAVPPMDIPIPDDADVMFTSDTEADFFAPADTFDVAAYLGTFSAQNCKPENEVGSPEGGIYSAFICLDESGRPAATLGVSISDSGDGSEVPVAVRVTGLSPSYRLAGFPEGAGDFVYSDDGTLSFSTTTGLEEVYAFYTADDASIAFADCTLVAEAGGETAASMQFLCTDYFNAEFSYDYLITVVISETETGAAVSLTFSEG